MAAEGPIASFPMDKEAAEEEIALLVRKPGFDELTPSDIVRHMNARFNLDFEAYRSQLKKMVFDQIKKRSDDHSSESSDEDNDSEKEEEEKKTVVKEEIVEKNEPKIEPKKEPVEAEDSDSDDGLDPSERYKPKPKSRKALAAAAAPKDLVSIVKSSRRSAASNALKQIRSTSAGGGRYSSKTKKEKDPNEDNSGKFGPMTKLCYISPELQQITKDQFMKRCDVVKVMWDYIKENNLKDPKSGQYFICDEILEPIFKKKRVKAFGMAKFLTRHIIGPNDMEPDVRAESEREMEVRRAAWLERKRQREAEEVPDDDAGPSEKKPKKEEVKEEVDDDDEGSSSDSD